MASENPHQDDTMHDDEPEEATYDPNEVEEEIADNGGDIAMDSDPDEEEIQLQNDSAAHFDHHKDSIFCIAQHPVQSSIVATGGAAEGDNGIGFIWDSTPRQKEKPVLPASYQSTPSSGGAGAGPAEREGLAPIQKLDGHTDSINAITFTLPKGEYTATAGLDGQLRVWQNASGDGQSWQFLSSVQEVEEINWLSACSNPRYPNTLAFGASDGSVWVYALDASDSNSPLTPIQTLYGGHVESCTAGSWTPDGRLLATVSEDGSFYVWDVFGEAGAAGIPLSHVGGQAVVGLTAQDERFKIEGGLYSVAVSPNGALAAVGGAEGQIRIVGLPRLGAESSATGSAKGAGAKAKSAGGKQAPGPKAVSGGSSGQAGQILAGLAAQSDGIETLSFSAPPLTLLAAGSVDGSIAVYDTARNFAVRRHISDAHDEEAVIKVEFVPSGGDKAWLLTSCGNDGVVRRWDLKGGTAVAGQQQSSGCVGEWRGHRGGGEGGGVLGFVQLGQGERIVTAGDDGVGLVFETGM